MKLQLLVRSGGDESAARFGERVESDLATRLLEATSGNVKLTLTNIEPPRVSVIPFRRERVALFSVWSEEDVGPLVEAIGAPDLEVSAYRVEESVPRAYERDWPTGEMTPGVGLLTVFDRKRGLDDATFLDRWHNGHTPLTLELHPVWNYVRNVVTQPVIEGTPPRDAIVEEHFRNARDLLSARVFFGGALAMMPNMVRVWMDIRGFIDLGSLESYLTREIWLRG